LNHAQRSIVGRPKDHLRTPGTHLVQNLVLFYAAIAAMLLAIFSRSFLPAKMLYDDRLLQDFIVGAVVEEGTIYGNTAHLYRLLGLGGSPTLVSVLAVLMLLASVILALRAAGSFGRTWPAVAIAGGTLVLGGIYLGLYTKEFFVVPLVALFITLSGRLWQEAGWLGLCILYASYVREYWFLVVVLYVVFRLFLRRIHNMRQLVVGWLLVIGAVTVVFNYLLGHSVTYFRTTTNDSLITDRATEIVDPVASSAVPLQWLNVVIVVVLLLMPVVLLTAGSALHVLSALSLAALWTLILLSIYRYLRHRVVRDVIVERAFALLIAFVTVQSLFEPDYGSYLRHLIPLLPLALVVVGRALPSGR
jgi:hypothetical protein